MLSEALPKQEMENAYPLTPMGCQPHNRYRYLAGNTKRLT